MPYVGLITIQQQSSKKNININLLREQVGNVKDMNNTTLLHKLLLKLLSIVIAKWMVINPY